jgi:hypothetical protein
MITKYLKDFTFILIKLFLTLIEDGFGTISQFRFSNWAAQDPTKYYGVQSCAVMMTSEIQPGKWLRVLCNSTHTATQRLELNDTILESFE